MENVDAEVIGLKSITGGKDETHNWLSDLNKGCVFLARVRDSKNDHDLMAYQVTLKTERNTQLVLNTPDLQHLWLWVDNARFSRKYECCDILQEKEEEHGESNSG